MATKKTTKPNPVPQEVQEEATPEQPANAIIEIPLIGPVISKKIDGQVCITKGVFEKGVDEFIHSIDPVASVYDSSLELNTIFKPIEDNPVVSTFVNYAIDIRRKVGRVIAMTPKSVSVLVKNDPNLLSALSKCVATLRFYYESKPDDSSVIKKGTFIHVIEVSVFPNEVPNPEPEQPEESTEPESVESDAMDENIENA